MSIIIPSAWAAWYVYEFLQLKLDVKATHTDVQELRDEVKALNDNVVKALDQRSEARKSGPPHGDDSGKSGAR